MRVWVSRDYLDGDTEKDSCINITGIKPRLSEDSDIWIYPSSKLCGFIFVEAFKENFGKEIPKGFCGEFELTLEEIE